MENVMLYSKFSERTVDRLIREHGYVMVQPKYDGARVYIKGGKVYTRQNKLINFPDCHQLLLDIACCYSAGFPRDGVFDGELLVFEKDSGKPLARKAGNGIINRLIKNKIQRDELNAYDFKIMVFDFRDNTMFKDGRNGWVYYLRHDFCDIIITPLHLDSLEVVPSFKRNSLDEVRALYAWYTAMGEEGIMVKNPMNLYTFKRVSDIVKMKAENVADLKVVEYTNGEGKYEGQVGALICETSDGKLRVSVGSGLTDADRLNPPPIDSIISVKYNAVIDSKTKDTKSLFLPRFVEMRTDKTTANSIDEL